MSQAINRTAVSSHSIFYDLKNPLQFLLRAAQVYPDKIALAHPDVEFPVYYSYAVLYTSFRSKCLDRTDSRFN